MAKDKQPPNESIHRSWVQEFGEPGPWAFRPGRRIGTCLVLLGAMALVVAMACYFIFSN